SPFQDYKDITNPALFSSAVLAFSPSLQGWQILLASAPAKSVHVTVVDRHHGGETMDLTGQFESEECHGAGGHRRSHITIACTHCDTYQAVEVDYDGGQGYAALPFTPCSICRRELCSFCDQTRCECGQIV